MSNSIEWIKISTRIFENRKIKQMLHDKNGAIYFKIFIQLLVLAGIINDRGRIYVTPKIMYDETTLSYELGESRTLTKLALNFLENNDMISISEGLISISSWDKYQNIDAMERVREQTRQRVKKHRDTQKEDVTVTECNDVDVTECNVTVTESNVTVTQQNKNKNKNKNNRKVGSNNISDICNAESNVTSFPPSVQSTQEKIQKHLDVITFYQSNFDPLMSSYIGEKIADDCEELGKENVLLAMQKAKLANKKDYRYISKAAAGVKRDAIYGPSEAYQVEQKEKPKPKRTDEEIGFEALGNILDHIGASDG